MPPRYRRKPIKENPERQIVLGLIVSDEFFKRVQPILNIDLIETPFIVTVINWCTEYHGQFGKVPGIHIEDIYKDQVKLGNIDEEQELLIEELLVSISNEYERTETINSAYLLDKAEKYFESINISRKLKSIKLGLDKGDIKAAQKEISEYNRIALPQSEGIDPFTDREGMRRAFEYASQPIFKLPGKAGSFLNDLFVNDSFVTLLGPEKRGKTWMLIELSMWARRAGLNVAFFSAGDMTLPQLQLRYGIRFAGKSHKQRYCGELKIPTLDCWHNQTDECECPDRQGISGVLKDEKKKELLTFDEAPDHEICTHCLEYDEKDYKFKASSWFKTREKVKPLSWEEASKAGEKLDKRWGKKSDLLLSAYSNRTLTVNEIRSQLYFWENEQGFIPNVIFVDYMDLLVSESAYEKRHSIDDIWADMRGLSQDQHCLVISASQSDAASYYIKWLSLRNFSEAKSKFSHVTGQITLNQLPDEKARGIMRLGQLAVREDASNEKNYVTILQSLGMGRPLLDSF